MVTNVANLLLLLCLTNIYCESYKITKIRCLITQSSKEDKKKPAIHKTSHISEIEFRNTNLSQTYSKINYF